MQRQRQRWERCQHHRRGAVTVHRWLPLGLLLGSLLVAAPAVARRWTTITNPPDVAGPRTGRHVCSYPATGLFHGVPFVGTVVVHFDNQQWELTFADTITSARVCTADFTRACAVDGDCAALQQCIAAPAHFNQEIRGTLVSVRVDEIVAESSYSGVQLWFDRQGDVLNLRRTTHAIAFDRLVPSWCGLE